MCKMSVVYKKVLQSNIADTSLDSFERYQETKIVLYQKERSLYQKEISFIDDWDQAKLNSICSYLKQVKGSVVFAYLNRDVIGFTNVEYEMFDNYMNMPFIHVSKSHRGKKIGANLFLLISKIALEQGAKKLYISSHPSIETQLFYKNLGCDLAMKVNQKLLADEPYDIQLEKVLDYTDIVMRKIGLEFKQQSKLSSVIINKLLNRIFQFMPEHQASYLQVCKVLLKSDNRYYFSLGTLLLKKKSEFIKVKNISFFEDILFDSINNWGEVDQYCYRVLGPIINQDESLYRYILKWSASENKNIRRASLVSMLTSSKMVTCLYDFDKAIFIVDRLKFDSDIHVQKACGWVLKCLYLENADKLVNYLEMNVNNLSRLIFRYALEHMDIELKNRLMKL